MTTAFIAEEYPDGFEGVTLPESELRRIAAQLRMGMQALLHAMDAERREISLSPAEFYTAPQEPRR